MAEQNNVPRPRPKIDKFTLIVYAIIGAFLLYICLLLGAAFDYSFSNGRIDTRKVGEMVSYLLLHPSKVFSALSRKGYAPKILFFGFIVIGIFALYKYSEDPRRLHRRGTEHGSAKWGSKKEMKALADHAKPQYLPIKKYDEDHPEGVRLFDEDGKFLCVEIDNNIILTKDVQLSLDSWGHKLNFNVLVIGGSGAQKTRGFAKPNIMQLNTSYVITDPKGELTEAEGELLRAAGYEVLIFNTIDMAHSNNYNPFHYVFDENGQVDETKVKSMIETLFTSTKGDGEKDDFWSQKGKSYLIAICFLLLAESEYTADRYTEGEKKGMVIPDTRDESHLNFYSVAEKLRSVKYPPQSSELSDGYFLTKNPGESDAEFEARREKAYLCQLDRDFIELQKHDSSIGRIALELYEELRNAPEETGQSFLSSANVKVFNFNLTGLKNLTCTDNIHLETIGDRKTALFIIISATDPTYRFLAAMLYSQLFDVLANRANFVHNGRLPVHVRCIMDEFANCGEIPNFNGIISFVRGMNMSLSVIIQNMSQLKSRYEKTWEEIPGNCDSILFLGGKEESTLKSISEQLGKETIDIRGHNRTKGKTPSTSENNSIVGRELLQINEVGSIPTTDCILMMRGHNPFYNLKYVLEEHPNYRFSGDADKAFSFDISNVHSVTYEEFIEFEKKKREQHTARKKAAAAIPDKPVTSGLSDAAKQTADLFFSSGDEVVIPLITPETFEEILEFANLEFSPDIEEETLADDAPCFGAVSLEYDSISLGEASEPMKEVKDDDEPVPKPAVIADDGTIEEETDNAGEQTESVHFDSVPPGETESIDDLSDFDEPEIAGVFSETLPDPDECDDIRPDFGDTHYSLDNPFTEM